MKRILLILLISLISIVGYGQIVIEETITVPTTLLTINGVVQGHILKGEPLLPAFNYVFVAEDTLMWTTIPIDSLQFVNTQLQNQVNQLLNRINELEIQINLLFPRFDYMEFELDTKVKWGDLILIGKPETTIE